LIRRAGDSTALDAGAREGIRPSARRCDALG